MQFLKAVFLFVIMKKESEEVSEMLSEMMKDELVHGLREIFHENMRMIILYGSVAREEATPESDIDIAIIMREEDIDEKTKEKFFEWSADMDLKYDRVFSIIDIPEERLKKWGKILPFYKNVQEEGIVLWKAA